MGQKSTIKTLWTLLLASMVSMNLPFARASTNVVVGADTPIANFSTAGDIRKEFNAIILENQTNKGLVGLAGIVVQNNRIIASAVHGERKKDSQVMLGITDQWHLGSITKSITATMIARLVEAGHLRWDTSIKEVFFDFPELNADWFEVTLDQLLTHTSGVQANFAWWVNLKKPEEGKKRTASRKTEVLKILSKAPTKTPGSQFLYSNVGFTIAGAMAEKITGISWEDLVRREIFAPLDIESGGFGPPRDKEDNLEQPRGHLKTWWGSTKAVDTETDNSPIIGPAGTVHMALEDLVMYANEHLQGEKGEGRLLQANTYQRLHTPRVEDYAYGWVVGSMDDGTNGPVIWHNGSNNMWYALVAFLPKLNAAIAVTSNDGNIESAETSAWNTIERLVPLLNNKETKPTK